jgi:hypothetical protein
VKRAVIILSIIVGFIQESDAQTPSAHIAFTERVYNFGTIEESKGKVSHTFVFKNNGKTDVTIADIHSACGCIGKAVTKGPVKPGAKGEVTITFDPVYKSGFFSKEIVVFSNNGNDYNRIWVEGNITAAEHPVTDAHPYKFGKGLYLRLKVMAFGYMKPGETKQVELHYANDINEEMTLNFVAQGNQPGLKFTNPGKIGPKAKGVMRVSYTMPGPGNDDTVIRINVYVNNKKLTEILEAKILSDNRRNQNSQSIQRD